MKPMPRRKFCAELALPSVSRVSRFTAFPIAHGGFVRDGCPARFISAMGGNPVPAVAPAIPVRDLISGRRLRPNAGGPRLRAVLLFHGADSRFPKWAAGSTQNDSPISEGGGKVLAVGKLDEDELRDAARPAFGWRRLFASDIAHRRLFSDNHEFSICPDSSGRTGIRRLNRVCAGA